MNKKRRIDRGKYRYLILPLLTFIVGMGIYFMALAYLSSPKEEKCELPPRLEIPKVLSLEEVYSLLKDNKSYRPDYEGVDKSIFENLPPYPKDFKEVWNLVYFGRLNTLENFSYDYPDEAYWKQPEFYADAFERNLYAWRNNMFYIAGSGPYPADVVILNLTRCEWFDVITFWHVSPVPVTKYQGLGFVISYPRNGSTRMGSIRVSQDPEVAKACFDVQIQPGYILLSPTYPKFSYNWTQKIKARIYVKPTCPKGTYLIQVSPGDPPADVEADWIRRYKLKYASMKVGGAWQIFVQVS